jgi:RNA polymerase sigma factor (sigma-70 family)
VRPFFLDEDSENPYCCIDRSVNYERLRRLTSLRLILSSSVVLFAHFLTKEILMPNLAVSFADQVIETLDAGPHSRPRPAFLRTAKNGDPPQSTRLAIDRESLYAEFAPLVQRLLRQYGSDAELLQDLAGEIYCRFCTLVDAFDPDRGVPLRPYLVRQLSAFTYTYVRSQRTLQKREAPVGWSEGNSAAEPSYDPTSSWIAELSQQQILQSLPHAIAQLPDRQRKVVCWRYIDDMPFDEISGILGIEPATVRSLLRHGINNLRKQMEPSGCCAA